MTQEDQVLELVQTLIERVEAQTRQIEALETKSSGTQSYLTVEQAAKALGCNSARVREMIGNELRWGAEVFDISSEGSVRRTPRIDLDASRIRLGKLSQRRWAS